MENVRIQVADFTNVKEMNNWLENFDGKVIDIKMAGESPYMQYLVIHEKNFKE